MHHGTPTALAHATLHLVPLDPTDNPLDENQTHEKQNTPRTHASVDAHRGVHIEGGELEVRCSAALTARVSGWTTPNPSCDTKVALGVPIKVWMADEHERHVHNQAPARTVTHKNTTDSKPSSTPPPHHQPNTDSSHHEPWGVAVENHFLDNVRGAIHEHVHTQGKVVEEVVMASRFAQPTPAASPSDPTRGGSHP